MDTQIVAVFCLCDDILKSLSHYEDRQCKIKDAEVITTAIVSGMYFGGNIEKARRHMQEYGYISKMISKSRFNRRLHNLSDLLSVFFSILGETWKYLNENSVYVIDSFPIAACDNYRICRSKLYQGSEWRGYQASKKRYYYGLKLHLLVTEHGEPVEFFLSPASFSDVSGLKAFAFDLPDGAILTGDKAYNDYVVEDVLNEAGIQFTPLRKKNSTRPNYPWIHYLLSSYRKVVETTGSLIEQLLPKHIHAVTARGFEIKVALFSLACSVNFLVG